MRNQDKATLIERLDVAGAHKSQMARALFGVLLLTHAVLAGSLLPTHLRCEFADDPLGVDIPQPRLGWRLSADGRGRYQAAYRVLVASSRGILDRNQGDLWDSGRVASGETLHIRYQGKALQSSQQVFWKLRVWDRQDNPSPWSPAATWTMGVLDPDAWQGRWIVAPWVTESLLLRKEFVVKSGLRRALVHVCGLGQYEMSLNGRKVGEDFLTPGWTDYTKTCLYDTRDITQILKPGTNAVGLCLGDGMYHTERRQRFSKFQGTFGPQRVITQIELEYEDGSRDCIGTDETWRVHPGPLTFTDIYGGEDFDARRAQRGWDRAGFDDSVWSRAVLLVRPQGTLRSLSCAAPPIRVIDMVQPVEVTDLPGERQVVDFGQNTAYMPRIRVTGPTGSTLRLTHAEVLNPDGTINRATCGGNRGPAYWQYTKATDGEETWFPQFFYVGCRYLQVERLAEMPGGSLPVLTGIEGAIVHSVAAPVGQFDCSNPLLGRIRNLVRWAQRSNMVSVLTDCPHREKLGWLEQYHLNGPSFRYEFDVTRMFLKGMNDMADAQLDSGLVPNIAPEYVQFKGTFRAAAEWGAAFFLVPWQHYLWTGDLDLLRRYYPAMRRYLIYLDTRASGHLLDEGLGDWYDLGPNKPGRAQLTPPEVTASAFYFQNTRLMSEIAVLLGEDADAGRYRQRADVIRTAYRGRFYHDDPAHDLHGQFATGSQCANALALVMGLAEDDERPALLAALVRDLRKRGNAVTAGDVGFRYLLLALARGGRSDVIYDMINQDEKPGYGYQLRQGATSLTESWDANHGASHNHFMLGQIIEWFYRCLVGIEPDPAEPGFRRIMIRPQPVGDLTWAEASHESIRGMIRVRWERRDSRFTLQVTLPANTRATVHVPAEPESQVTEGDAAAHESPGVTFLRREGDRMVYDIESGSYRFESRDAR